MITTIGGQVITATPDKTSIGGTALTPGAPEVTVGGTLVSLDTAGQLILRSKIIALQSGSAGGSGEPTGGERRIWNRSAATIRRGRGGCNHHDPR